MSAQDPFDRGSLEQGELFDAGGRLKLGLNDRDNGTRLWALAAHRLIYVPGRGWGVWDGRRFDFDAGEELALRLVSTELPKAIEDEAAAKTSQPISRPQIEAWLLDHADKKPADAERALKAAHRPTYKKFANDCANNARAVAALLAARALFLADVDDLDCDPWRLTCENGVIDLKALAAPAPDAEDAEERILRLGDALGPFDPGMRGTRRPAARFDPEADCPGWRSFVSKAFPNPASAAYFQRALAVTLFGRNERQVVLVMLGQGGNGKSTALNMLKFVLGGYAATTRIEMFLETKFSNAGAPTPEEAVLPGARAYVGEEPEAGAVLSAAKVKGLTGGAPRQSRPLHGKPFTWTPHGVPVLAFNKMPRVSDETEGMWRRLVPIHFQIELHKLPRADRLEPTEMARVIAAEASGILNWLLEGWVALAERAELPDTVLQGLDPPEDVLDLKAQLRAQADPVGEFLADTTERISGARIGATDLHRVYEIWCARNGAEPLALRTFGRVMIAKDYRKKKQNTMVWRDLSWLQRPDVEELLNELAARERGSER